MRLTDDMIRSQADKIRPWVQHIITETRELTIDQLRKAFQRAHYHDATIHTLTSDRSLNMVLDEICAC